MKLYRKLICFRCSEQRKAFVKMSKEKYGVECPKDYAKTMHILFSDIYYPKVEYECVECGTKRTVKCKERRVHK